MVYATVVCPLVGHNGPLETISHMGLIITETGPALMWSMFCCCSMADCGLSRTSESKYEVPMTVCCVGRVAMLVGWG